MRVGTGVAHVWPRFGNAAPSSFQRNFGLDRISDVERVVEVAASPHAEVKVDPLALFDDVVEVADHLDAKIAVDAVMLL